MVAERKLGVLCVIDWTILVVGEWGEFAGDFTLAIAIRTPASVRDR
jgi:hypothetical protein